MKSQSRVLIYDDILNELIAKSELGHDYALPPLPFNFTIELMSTVLSSYYNNNRYLLGQEAVWLRMPSQLCASEWGLK